MFLCNRYDLDFIIFTLILILLASDSISPSIADNSDDFPEPTEPTTATSDPSGIFRLILNATNRTCNAYVIFFCTSFIQSHKLDYKDVAW